MDGIDGKDGVDCKDGIGISGVEINAEGSLVLSFSDGKNIDLGRVVGKNGTDGKNGIDGKNGNDGKDGAGG